MFVVGVTSHQPMPKRPNLKKAIKSPSPSSKNSRPRAVPLDARERQRRRREKKRSEGKTGVEIWIREEWRDRILSSGKTLQEAANEAFAAWVAKLPSSPRTRSEKRNADQSKRSKPSAKTPVSQRRARKVAGVAG